MFSSADESVEVTTATQSNFFTKPSFSSKLNPSSLSLSEPYSQSLDMSHAFSPTHVECYLDSIDLKNSMACSGSGIKSYVDELQSARPISFSLDGLTKTNLQVAKESNIEDRMELVDRGETVNTRTISSSNLLVSTTSKISASFARFRKQSTKKLFGLTSQDSSSIDSTSSSSLAMSRNPDDSAEDSSYVSNTSRENVYNLDEKAARPVADSDISSYLSSIENSEVPFSATKPSLASEKTNQTSKPFSEVPVKNAKSKTQRIMEKSPQEGQ
jgi:hypothetical protein